jgi:hypothetical protein
MIVATVDELVIMAVLERGVPNKECVVIRADENVNLGRYGLMLGISSGSNSAWPIKDNLLWFGDGWIKKDDWLFVYTGPGHPTSNLLPNTGETTYSIHWGRSRTIFHTREVVPILFRVDAVAVAEAPPAMQVPPGATRA